MPGCVENGNNQNRIICHLVDYAVRETVRKYPADIPAAMAPGCEQGVGGRSIDFMNDGLDKFTTES